MVEKTNFLSFEGLKQLVAENDKRYALKSESLIIDGETLILNDDDKVETKYKVAKVSYEEYMDLVEAGECDEFTVYYIDEGADTPTIRIGTTDISAIGDGTVTGAIKELHDLFSLDKTLSLTSAKGVENRAIAKQFEQYYLKEQTPVKLAMLFDANHNLTIQLQNSRGEVIGEQTKNLMIESVVVGGTFIEETGTLMLVLSEGDPIEIPISSLVSGLVDSATKIAGIDLKDDITKAELTLALNPATASSQGMMSSADKTKLDNLDLTEIESALETVEGLTPIEDSEIETLFS